jgi:hypothetical protein
MPMEMKDGGFDYRQNKKAATQGAAAYGIPD